MIPLLILTAYLSPTNFASSICQQRYELDRGVVCQPNGEFASRQCSLQTDTCYCTSETGEAIDGTSFSTDKNYVCKNVIYKIIHVYKRGSPGFSVNKMLDGNNPLTEKLERIDRRAAVWIMKNVAAVAEDSTDAASETHNQYEGVLLGYNTRITDEDVLTKVANVFGVSDDSDVSRVAIKIYDSVHEGECAAETVECDDSARVCYSDSECKAHEKCCSSSCGSSRCLAVGWYEGTTTPLLSTEPLTSPDWTTELTPVLPTTEPLTTAPLSTTSPSLGRDLETTTPTDVDTTSTMEFSETTTDTTKMPYESTTEPFTDESTTEPFTEESTTEPFTDELTTEPFTDELTSEPFTDELTTEPLKEESTTVPFTEESTTEPFTEESTTEPFTEESTTVPFTEESTTEPFTDESTTEPLTVYFESTTEPFTDESTTEPLTDELTTEPFTDELTTETFTEESTTEPFTDESTTEPLTVYFESTTEPFTEESTTVPLTEESTTVPFTDESTTVPLTEESTTVPFTDESTTVPFTEDSTTEPFTDESTTEPFTEESTTEPFTDESTTEQLIESSTSSTRKHTTTPYSSTGTTFVNSLGTAETTSEPPPTSTTNWGSDGTSTATLGLGSTEGTTDPISFVTEELVFLSSTETEAQETSPLPSTESSTPTMEITSKSSFMSVCEREAFNAISEARQGPLCLDDGSFSPQQCDSSRGMCWCVSEEGLELRGSIRYGSSANCDEFQGTTDPPVETTSEPLSDCWNNYQKAIRQQASEPDVMIPHCQSDGLYAGSQCQGTFCWCVDENDGTMLQGTKKPGPIDCNIFVNGICPTYQQDHQSVCTDKCNTDEHCYGTTMCCQTACGRDCVYPQLPENLKEGQCPAPLSLNSIFDEIKLCTEECSNDQKCLEDRKCCFNGCGHTCTDPVFDTNVYCKKVDTLYNGEVLEPRDQYTEGDVIRIGCDHGYELQGAEQIRCQADGEWDNELPKCKRISCGPPGSGQFVIVRGNDYYVGGVVSYACYSGYELVGNAAATCLLNGRWDTEPPTCTRRECPLVNELEYGRVYGNSVTTYGNRIGFRCDYGYTLVGSEQRLCLSDGSWSGTDARCVRGYFNRSRRNKFASFEADETGSGECQYKVVNTIDYDGSCVEDIFTIDCSCGEPNTIEQEVKVKCQSGPKEFVTVKVPIGMDCSCCSNY